MNTIFVSYSHKDVTWKQHLLRSLDLFVKHDVIKAWHDECISGGSDWEIEIGRAIASAQLAVLLLTEQALTSQFICTNELTALQRRHQVEGLPVIPILCEPCDWPSHAWLRTIQIRPFECVPLSKLTKSEGERRLRDIASEIAKMFGERSLRELSRSISRTTPTRVHITSLPITFTRKLLGRQQECALLDLAYADKHAAVLELVAWGGVGKTALVMHWLSRLQQLTWLGAASVYGWSFHSQGTTEDRQASEDSFFAHALDWFSVTCKAATSASEKGRLLADAVAREGTILILDGVEPLQYPPGSMGGRLRTPGILTLLRRLSSVRCQGICIVTSREPLIDLSDSERGGEACGSVLRIDLQNLTAEAGGALLHNAGVCRAGAAPIEPHDDELLSASQEVDGHALTLTMLGTFLARAYNGDIRRRHQVEFDRADSGVQGGHAFKMMRAYEQWLATNDQGGNAQLAILRLVGLFDRPADSGCLNVLRQLPAISDLTEPLVSLDEEDWNVTVSALSDCGLVAYRHDDCSLDAHPLVREYFAKRLREEAPLAWTAANRRLYEHLRDRTEEMPSTLAGLDPLFRAVTHGARAGLAAQAYEEVYYPRISHGDEAYSVWRVGAISETLAAISSFFLKPWSQIDPTLKKSSISEILNDAGYFLMTVGRISEAKIPLKSSLDASLKHSDWRIGVHSACNLCEIQLALGELNDALCTAQCAVECSDRTGAPNLRRVTRCWLGYALSEKGHYEEALLQFREAESIQAAHKPATPFLFSIEGYLYCDVLLHAAEEAAWRGNSCESILRELAPTLEQVEKCAKRALAFIERLERLLDVADDQLTLGRCALYRAIFATAKDEKEKARESSRSFIEAAVEGLRRSGHADHIPLGLLSHSWLCALEGDSDGARGSLNEAWQIAERGPMRLHMARIHLYRARFFYAVTPYPWNRDKHGQPRGPKDDVAAARALLEHCGCSRRKKELEDTEEALRNWPA